MNFLDLGQIPEIAADGIHDDTAAIQHCLDRMKDGGILWFPDGIYRISACLIFYSHQRLIFSDDAVLLRAVDEGCEPTRYLLASYSDPETGGYDGTHDVLIAGGIFDGNVAATGKLTMFNTVHCRDITIRNCHFRCGSMWHYIELNSTKNAVIENCVFDGTSYTAMRDDLTSELIQTDAPLVGTYGPVYNCDGTLIDFLPDRTPCTEITIRNCLFKCDGFSAIGHHGNDEHTAIRIEDNIFTGRSGKGERSRGYITFMEKVHDVTVAGNVFLSSADDGQQNRGIVTMNPDPASCTADRNVFRGVFSGYFSGGITASDNRIDK